MHQGPSHHEWNPEAEGIARLHGVAQLDAYLDLAQRLEGRGDVEGGIDVLRRGIDAASWQGRLQYTLQFFGHLRRIYHQDLTRAHLRRSVLWYYKWIAAAVIQYAEVPLPTVEAVIDDMERCYAQEGVSLRPVWKIRCLAAMYTGKDDAEQQRWFDRWETEPRTDADDCAACEWGFRAERLIILKHDADALEVAEPVKKTSNWCRATPEIASLLILPAIRCEQSALANWLSRVSAHAARTRGSLIDALGHHVVYHGMRGHLDRGRRLAIVGLHRANESRNDRRNNIFYRLLAYWAALATLQTGGTMKLPAKLFGRADPTAPPLSCAEVVEASLIQARTHATALDTRNGTDLYTTRVDQLEAGIREMFSNPNEQKG